MAGEEENVEVEDQNNIKKAAKFDSSGVDLEKVTDYVEEAEISSQNIGDAMRLVSDQQTREAVAKQMKEKELSKIKITKEDVDLIVNEMEISRNLAERTLREHQGNVVEALCELVN